MFKKILVVAVLTFSGTAAEAANRPGGAVFEAVQSTMTCLGMDISTATAAPGPSNIVGTARYSFVAVTNEHATANLFCSERSDVTTSGAKRGSKVAATKTRGWLIPLETLWYCISDGAASTAAMICKGF